MTESTRTPNHLDRREFLTAAALAGAGSIVSARAAQGRQTTLPGRP